MTDNVVNMIVLTLLRDISTIPSHFVTKDMSKPFSSEQSYSMVIISIVHYRIWCSHYLKFFCISYVHQVNTTWKISSLSTFVVVPNSIPLYIPSRCAPSTNNRCLQPYFKLCEEVTNKKNGHLKHHLHFQFWPHCRCSSLVPSQHYSQPF